ncbi:hypothetical protein MRX96_034892 [Rhipicephalus microplus]
MWKNDLEVLLYVSEDASASFCKSVSSRQFMKSYNFAVEAYSSPPSVATNTCDLRYASMLSASTLPDVNIGSRVL